MLEVNRTSRQHRRHGKHDAGDAEAAARAVMADTTSNEPKGANGATESLRALRVARRSAVKARTQAANQLHALLSTAPDEVGGWTPGHTDSKLHAIFRTSREHQAGKRVEWDGVKISPRYKFKNATILDWLEVTREEERHFKTIISDEERRRLDRRKHRARYGVRA